MIKRTGGQILVDQLKLHGTSHVFCVPGESYLAVLDALHDAAIKTIVCRQEGGAAYMAEAAGKMTGRPGIVMVTRGPGATNASCGVHVAAQDSTPLIMFVGQVARGMKEREAFQEIDCKAVFGSMAKWVVEIDRAERIPEIVSRAFHVATQGRPGPVVIALPEDMLADRVEVADAPPCAPVVMKPGAADMEALRRRLLAAERPIVLAGGSGWSEQGVKDLVRFAEAFDLPVAVTFRRQMLFPADHPNFAGDLGIGPNPKLLQRVKDADLVLLVGGRLSEMPSQSYTLLDIPGDGLKLVHVHPGAEELNKVYRAGLGILATPHAFTAAAAELPKPNAVNWAGAPKAAHADYLAWSDTSKVRTAGSLQMAEVMEHLKQVMPADTVYCNGAGNYATWVHRFWPFRAFASQLAPTSGTMGYGVPASVAAKSLKPGREVIAFAGDGCFMMNGQEFATLMQYGLPVIVVVVDNGMYGTIRMHQEREYPNRISATELKNPDFAALARAYGGHGETVRTTAEFGPALARARTSGTPAIIHCLLDPEAITPARSLSDIRNASLKK
ncbi:MAG: thiamine pyrophosphate-binding protein [Aestuariivirga sp.]|uniref:thiamine pyrophosphate-binding protein n=1 Tax=Aestuariivirga sp. TaxID=2650926 RepID=UPI0025B8137F|nr:thiamine pyrophosphate-binding protein [Aestuariivirga sp.]MCA3562229.1 thiamine pyrophosphate-binding protein [Aestuariivirga sp.]